MVRRRSASASLFHNPHFANLSTNEQMMLISLSLLVDGEGRGRVDITHIAQEIAFSPEIVSAFFAEEGKGLLHVYEVAGQRYYQIKNWYAYCPFLHPTPLLFPAPPSVQ